MSRLKCEFEEIEGNCLREPQPDGSDPRTELFCPTHCEFDWRVCGNCGGDAIRVCGHDVNGIRCRMPLCNLCSYNGKTHARRDVEPPHGDDLKPPRGQDAITALRADLTQAIKDSLVYAKENDFTDERAAEFILSNLGLHVTFQMLSGMAAHPPE